SFLSNTRCAIFVLLKLGDFRLYRHRARSLVSARLIRLRRACARVVASRTIHNWKPPRSSRGVVSTFGGLKRNFYLCFFTHLCRVRVRCDGSSFWPWL